MAIVADAAIGKSHIAHVEKLRATQTITDEQHTTILKSLQITPDDWTSMIAAHNSQTLRIAKVDAIIATKLPRATAVPVAGAGVSPSSPVKQSVSSSVKSGNSSNGFLGLGKIFG